MLHSAADEDDIRLYSQEFCHVMATALHRMFHCRMLVVLDSDEIYWQDDADPDNFVPSVVHVYALDGQGSAWDVLGVRPQEDVREDVCGRWRILQYDSDEIRGEGELSVYVGDDRPLASFTEEDVLEAQECARRIFGALLLSNPTI